MSNFILFTYRYSMKNSKSLNLTMKDVTHIPDSVFDDALTAEVNIIDLCKNKLTALPARFKI